jgi:hypothetical protein
VKSSSLPDLTRDQLPKPPLLYHETKKGHWLRVLCFMTTPERLEQYAIDANIEGYNMGHKLYNLKDIIANRLPREIHQDCVVRTRKGVYALVYVLATNKTREAIDKGKDSDYLNECHDAIGIECGPPIWAYATRS